MGGGFGFGSLLDVQMLGFYQAQHQATQKHFLAYVLQVSTPDGPYLIYRFPTLRSTWLHVDLF